MYEITSATTEARLIRRLSNFGDEAKCWEFSRPHSTGYGYLFTGVTSVRAHRLAYQLFVGDIPSGLVLDHLCGNRACCNPSHLEPVTATLNTQRGKQWEIERTGRCTQGHDMTVHGVRTNKGKNACRECGRRSVSARKAKSGRLFGALDPPQPCSKNCGWMFVAPGPKVLHERACNGSTWQSKAAS